MKIWCAQQGFILVTLMIFIIIITFICLQAMENSLLQSKMSHNLWSMMSTFYTAETALIKAEQHVQTKDISSIALSNENTKAEWLAYGKVLTIKGMQARYSAIKLQMICYEQAKQKVYLDFYRITVWVLNEQLYHPIVLQSTYIKPGNPPAKDIACLAQPIPKLGRQSWYELN